MIFMNHMLKRNHIITINNVNKSNSCQNYPIERKCMTSGKTQYIYIIYILCVDDDSGDTQHKMKAGDVTVYNQARGEGKRMGLIPYIWAGAKKYKVKNTEILVWFRNIP